MRFSIGILLVFFAGTLQAIEQAKGGESRKITFRTLAYFNRGETKDIYYKNGEEVRKLALPRMNLSPKYEVPAGRSIILGQKDEKGEFVPEYSIAFTEHANEWVLLMLTPEKGSLCKFLLLNFDPKEVGYGETVIYNTTNKYLVGNAGVKAIRVGPKKKVKIRDAEVGRGGSYTVFLRVGNGSKFRPLARNVWVKNSNVRRIGFVVTDRHSKRTRVLCFPELRQRE